MVLKQNEALLDNSKELRKFAVLKVDHLTEVRQHERATKRLQAAEGDIRGLKIKLQVQSSVHMIQSVEGLSYVVLNTAKYATFPWSLS